ncbi:nuclear receptor-binding factor 2-like [Xyrauchen texanus]|uniref:nuclear receptor-binding factor 2-like n=1 Tax=Xyrauchen texanus TaxID=154827 RepID=UPI0022421177|nr:nuclear receptor-binding factor 2-like [Xyrauchen texanus]
MEVVDSPLNLAHQQCRKADRLLAAGKFEDAISCHRKATELLKEAMTLTECEQARLSLELQRDSHVKQQRLIEERWKRARREDKPRTLQHVPSSDLPLRRHPHPGAMALDISQASEREYDTWLYLLKNKGTTPEPCPGSKAQKDDKTRLEEQQTTIHDLRKLVDRLVSENEHLKQENENLRAENRRLKKEPYVDADFVDRSELWVLPQPGEERKAKDIPIPQLPPLEMPTQEIPLEDLPSLELPEDIKQELQELLDGEKL